jgi:hypothetical protein
MDASCNKGLELYVNVLVHKEPILHRREPFCAVNKMNGSNTPSCPPGLRLSLESAHATDLGSYGKLQLVTTPRQEGIATESRVLEIGWTAHQTRCAGDHSHRITIE